jgi:hypothetical protein
MTVYEDIWEEIHKDVTELAPSSATTKQLSMITDFIQALYVFDFVPQGRHPERNEEFIDELLTTLDKL